MSDQDRAAPDMGAPASRLRRLGRYALVVIACAIAALAGWGQGQYRTTDQPSGFSSSPTDRTSTPNCPPLAGATVTDQLTFHSNALLGPYEISRTVMVPIDDPNAHAFLTRRDPVVRRAVACLFPASITGAPELNSVKDGMATLTASSQLPLSPPKVPHHTSPASAAAASGLRVARRHTPARHRVHLRPSCHLLEGRQAPHQLGG